MRVAVVESAAQGGLLHYAAQLADALAERGHSVVLITARDSEMAGRTRGARLHPVLVAPIRRPSEPPRGIRYVARRAWIAARLTAGSCQTVWELQRGGYDVAVLVDDFNLALAATPALVLTYLPRGPALAAICHEPRPRNRWSRGGLFVSSRLLLGTLRRLYPRLDLVFVHGERTLAEFTRTWPPTRVAVIPHGDERIVADTPPPQSDEERVLFFGDWRAAKGLHLLMSAFERLERDRPEARLTIAGTPSPDGDPDRVRRWAAARPARVEVIDRYVPLEAVPELFARARVVATPYIAGSQSGVLHLAMTMERAVVTSDVGELGRTVADGETGLVVPAGDVDALADALGGLLGDPGLCSRLGAEARRRLLAESGWERVAERVEAELRALPALRRQSAAPAA
jgi:glycosyltransferase involved in cell wall biosynthesis